MENESVTQDARLRRGSLGIWDVLCWFLAALAIMGVRYDLHLPDTAWVSITVYALSGAVLQLSAGWATKVYQGRYRVGSFEETSWLATIVIGIWMVLTLIYAVGSNVVPRGIVLMTPFVALLLMAAGRAAARAVLQRFMIERSAEAEPVIVYGAGNAGAQLAALLAVDPDAPFNIVGFVDDDRNKRHLHLGRHRVLGSGRKLLEIARTTGARSVILAIPTASSPFIREVTELVEGAGMKLYVLPKVSDMKTGRVELSQLHRVDVADLLGRQQVQTDLGGISGYLNAKVVLITGAGGSIGSEIARQVHKFGPKELVLLDRDESGLHAVQLSIYGKGLLDTPDMVLCDIRDEDALDRVFAFHQPDVVFHAAALKHLPMLEQYPNEGWKTNVLGTRNVLDASRRYGVQHFVNISTDKAADATSVLGKTKRVAEQLTSFYAASCPGTWLSVRFGNVLGSRGSMLHTFTQQIDDGGPVTVTHPDITRYFMTIPEACQLTIQAGAIGEPGDVLVLDMGEPVRILDVAKRLIEISGKPIDITFTGLRPGEKLHEVLFSHDEHSDRTSHSLISKVHVPPIDPDTLDEFGDTREMLRTRLRGMLGDDD